MLGGSRACECGVTDWRHGDWIQTYSGKPFWPYDPRVEDLDIDDIAESLSRTGRFGEHSLIHYNLADHSVWVMNRLIGTTAKVQLAALLHDSAEAYLRDLPRAVKYHPQMDFYRAEEEKLKRLILSWAGVLDAYLEFGRLIKLYDNIALSTERRDLMAPCRFTWGSLADYPPHHVQIRPSVSAESSRRSFKYHYDRLSAAVRAGA